MFYRQAKAKRVKHHKANFTRNFKKKKKILLVEEATNWSMKIMKEKKNLIGKSNVQ